MKNFRDYLREFIEPSDDHHARIRKFAENTPFTHVTTNGDVLHFNSSQDAAEEVAHSLAKQEMARVHSHKKKDAAMHEYTLAATGTHDDVLDALTNHLMNHPKLPYDLIDSVPGYIEHIVSNEDKIANHLQQMGSMLAPRGADGPQSDLGAFTAKKHSHPDTEILGVHPHLYDDTHHLKDVIEKIKDNPSSGYFLKKEEYK